MGAFCWIRQEDKFEILSVLATFCHVNYESQGGSGVARLELPDKEWADSLKKDFPDKVFASEKKAKEK